MKKIIALTLIVCMSLLTVLNFGNYTYAETGTGITATVDNELGAAIKSIIKISSSTDIQLNKLVIKLYFSDDYTGEYSFFNDNTGITLSTSPFYVNINTDVSSSVTTQDGLHCLTITFNNSSTYNSCSMSISCRLMHNDWSNFTGSDIKYEIVYDDITELSTYRDFISLRTKNDNINLDDSELPADAFTTITNLTGVSYKYTDVLTENWVDGLPNTAGIYRIKAYNGIVESNIITINLYIIDAKLTAIYADGVLLSGFNPETKDYHINVSGGSFPVITAESSDPLAVVEIVQPDSGSLKATITVTAQDLITTDCYTVYCIQISNDNDNDDDNDDDNNDDNLVTIRNTTATQSGNATYKYAEINGRTYTNRNIANKLRKLNDGNSVTIDISKSQIIRKEWLKAIKGRNVTVKFDLGYKAIEVNGTDVEKIVEYRYSNK